MTILAVGLLGTVYVVVRQDEQPYKIEEIFPNPVIVDPTMRPDFDFPEEIRSTNLDLNRFIDRFFRVCADGDYSEFRLMYASNDGNEISPQRFESTYNVLKSARILALRKLPPRKDAGGEEYLLVVEYDLETFAPTSRTKDNQTYLMIGQQDGRWRFLGPRSKEQLAKYGEDILSGEKRNPTTQPASDNS